MKQNPLEVFRRLRESLTAERDALTARLNEINEAFGSDSLPATGPMPAAFASSSNGRKGKRKISAATRKKLVEAQRLRRERERVDIPASAAAAPAAAKGTAKSGLKTKGVMSEEQKAKISATQKKIWAARKKAATKAGAESTKSAQK